MLNSISSPQLICGTLDEMNTLPWFAIILFFPNFAYKFQTII